MPLFLTLSLSTPIFCASKAQLDLFPPDIQKKITQVHRYLDLKGYGPGVLGAALFLVCGSLASQDAHEIEVQLIDELNKSIERRRQKLSIIRAKLEHTLQEIVAKDQMSPHDVAYKQMISDQLRHIDEEYVALAHEYQQEYSQIQPRVRCLKCVYAIGTVVGGLGVAYSLVYHMLVRDFALGIFNEASQRVV